MHRYIHIHESVVVGVITVVVVVVVAASASVSSNGGADTAASGAAAPLLLRWGPKMAFLPVHFECYFISLADIEIRPMNPKLDSLGQNLAATFF